MGLNLSPRRYLVASAAFAVVLVLAIALAYAQQVPIPQGTSDQKISPDVGDALERSEWVLVIVSLDEQAIGALRARDDDSRFAARSAAVDSVLRRLPSSSYKNAWHDPHISGFFLDINKDALQALGSAPEVRRVEYYPSMKLMK